MSTAPVVPVAAPPVPVTVPPAPKLTSIQIIEQEIQGFIKQREQAIANVHAVEGAIQAGQHLLGKLKAEVQKAEAATKVAIDEAEIGVAKAAAAVVEKL